MTSEGKAFAATLAGVYPDHDLALLDYDVSDAELTPLDLSQAAPLPLGSFILMANPDGNVESLGVVSVESRSLRDGDKAYLGVMMDFSNGARGHCASENHAWFCSRQSRAASRRHYFSCGSRKSDGIHGNENAAPETPARIRNHRHIQTGQRSQKNHE